MKKCITSLCCCFVLFFNGSVWSQEYVIAVSPYMDVDTAKTQAKDILKFLTSLKPGDKALIVDGYHLATIGEFHVPTNRAYHNPKAILGANSQAVGGLMRFVKRSSLSGRGNNNTTHSVLRLPQLLHYVANNFPTEHKMDVIILGSPFYDDPRETDFSMMDGQVPSDGHLLSSRAETPYGTRGNPERLKNVRVHMGYGAEDIMQSDKHRFFVQRFWTLFIEQQQGQLVTFTADLPMLLRKVQSKAMAPKHDHALVASSKLEMISLSPALLGKAIFERPISMQVLSSQKRRRAEKVEIGLSWDNCMSCDLDLYARPFQGLKILYFNHTSSPEGRYWKDYRQSGEKAHGYEIIAFNVPLDLQALQIVVNFYDGNAPNGVTGKLRLSVADKTYETAFHINAQQSNKGGGVNEAFNTGTSPYKQTLIFDPLKIVRAR